MSATPRTRTRRRPRAPDSSSHSQIGMHFPCLGRALEHDAG
jgi:hypothetical protein